MSIFLDLDHFDADPDLVYGLFVILINCLPFKNEEKDPDNKNFIPQYGLGADRNRAPRNTADRAPRNTAANFSVFENELLPPKHCS